MDIFYTVFFISVIEKSSLLLFSLIYSYRILNIWEESISKHCGYKIISAKLSRFILRFKLRTSCIMKSFYSLLFADSFFKTVFNYSQSCLSIKRSDKFSLVIKLIQRMRQRYIFDLIVRIGLFFMER